MKKVLAAILSLIYLVTANGIAMNLHYCCGKLDKVAVSYTTGMSADYVSGGQHTAYSGNECCMNVHKQFKITQSHHNESDILFNADHTYTAVLSDRPEIPQLYFSAVAKGNFSPHGPPLLPKDPIYLKHCSFLI